MSNRLITKVLINKKFQFKFVIVNTILATLMSLGYLLAIKLFFNKFFEMGEKAGFPDGHVFFKFVQKQEGEIYSMFLITYLVILVVFAFVSLKMSHKVAGPFYRMNIHLKEIVKNGGKLLPIKFRQDDDFLEIQDSFNEVVEIQSDTKGNSPQ